jgi:hypothetical protein
MIETADEGLERTIACDVDDAKGQGNVVAVRSVQDTLAVPAFGDPLTST